MIRVIPVLLLLVGCGAEPMNPGEVRDAIDECESVGLEANWFKTIDGWILDYQCAEPDDG